MRHLPKYALFGLGEKALVALTSLPKEFLLSLVCVVVGEDGGVQNDYSKELSLFCSENGIRKESRKNETVVEADYIFAIGWRWIIHSEPFQKVIVFHDSLLPKYRGFNPLVTALINGDKEIGVTALFGAERYDSGDIIACEKISILHPIRIQSAIELISNLYGKLFFEILERISKGNIVGHPQRSEEATYSLWRDEEDYNIDWEWSAQRIQRFVYAVGFPYGGARVFADGVCYLIDDVSVVPDVKIENRSLGKVIFKEEGFPVVVCGSGLVKILRMRLMDTGEIIFPNRFRIRFT